MTENETKQMQRDVARMRTAGIVGKPAQPWKGHNTWGTPVYNEDDVDACARAGTPKR